MVVSRWRAGEYEDETELLEVVHAKLSSRNLPRV
jgi:hypothetical protein